jgi:hypothetical protein
MEMASTIREAAALAKPDDLFRRRSATTTCFSLESISRQTTWSELGSRLLCPAGAGEQAGDGAQLPHVTPGERAQERAEVNVRACR